jgi:tetratricopeptide (TPR) repeat protein
MESLCCNTLVFANCAGDKVSAEQILQLQLRLTVAKGEQGKLVDAERICNEALALARESVPDHPLTQMLEEELFNIQSRLSILEKINEMLDQIETANREAADADVARQLEADAHSGEGWFKDEIAAIKKLSQHGEFQQAKHDASLILFVARKHGSKNIIAQVLMILAEANFNLGDLEQAKEVYQEAADLYQGSDDPDNPIRSAAQQNLSALDALVSGSKR